MEKAKQIHICLYSKIMFVVTNHKHHNGISTFSATDNETTIVQLDGDTTTVDKQNPQPKPSWWQNTTLPRRRQKRKRTSAIDADATPVES